MTIASNDLSLQHQSITDRFTMPSSPAEWQAYCLTLEEIDAYEALGYVAGVPVLAKEHLAWMREQCRLFAEIVIGGESQRVLLHEWSISHDNRADSAHWIGMGAWRILPSMHDFVWNPAWTVPASQLLRGAVRLGHDCLARYVGDQPDTLPWTQSYSRWTHTTPTRQLSCWVPLPEDDSPTACFECVPGSHQWGMLEAERLQAFGCPSNASFLVSITLQPGEAVFIHPLLVHRIHGMKEGQCLDVMSMRAMRDGVRSNCEQPILPGIPIIPKGKPLLGQFFPLVYDGRVTGV